MPTYYPGPDVKITDKAFTVLGDRPSRFQIKDLVDPYVVRGDRHPAGVVTGRFAIGTVVIGTVSWPIHDSLLLHAAILVAVAIPVLATGACLRAAPRTYQLWAVHRSTEVCLYSTAHPARFGQVRRALVRAVEEQHRQRATTSWLREIER
ncbi:hypothetical protein Ais01nite_33130 [Asanoa ishikariensis]|uniref:Uncharacterized protein n=1 Tax=Asanoa ishikariensis TaxID=137265 RepID=A0A1H3UWU6_9ACTN|nr:DUF6232 family protein [Asanoa ishikariensis]GIF65278.1 hypothetical protein Ais01nite_33130 [Asanoa ishikariensis]SDZ66818.1 hypothetical protein SAMN05421684_8314 [Asanoa ishikariensis]